MQQVKIISIKTNYAYKILKKILFYNKNWVEINGYNWYVHQANNVKNIIRA